MRMLLQMLFLTGEFMNLFMEVEECLDIGVYCSDDYIMKHHDDIFLSMQYIFYVR